MCSGFLQVLWPLSLIITPDADSPSLTSDGSARKARRCPWTGKYTTVIVIHVGERVLTTRLLAFSPGGGGCLLLVSFGSTFPDVSNLTHTLPDAIITIPISLLSYLFLPDLPWHGRGSIILSKEDMQLAAERMNLIGRKGTEPWSRVSARCSYCYLSQLTFYLLFSSVSSSVFYPAGIFGFCVRTSLQCFQ